MSGFIPGVTSVIPNEVSSLGLSTLAPAQADNTAAVDVAPSKPADLDGAGILSLLSPSDIPAKLLR